MACGLAWQTAATQWMSSAAHDTKFTSRVIGIFRIFMNEKLRTLGHRENAGNRACLLGLSLLAAALLTSQLVQP